MPRRHPADFPLDDLPVYEAYVSSRKSAALAVGVRLGLFDALDVEPLTEVEIGARFELKPRPVRSLTAALFAMGMLDHADGGRWALTPVAAQYAVRGKPGSLHALIDMEVDHPLTPATLLDALRRDEPSVYGGDDPWEAHEQDSDTARKFTEAMHSVSGRPAAGFAEVAPLDDVRRLLDVGGGSGALSLAAARAHPDLHCTVFDLPVVCEVARGFIDEAGLAERVHAAPGDMFRDDYPADHDAVLFSQILHDWSPDTCAQLVAKAVAALPSGGRLLVHEKLVADDGRGPLENALVHLDMLVWTEGQQWSEAGLRELLGGAGLVDITCAPTAGSWSVVAGVKA